MNKQVIKVAAGVIFDRNQRLLACERPQGKALAGKWEFPGGKLEPGETAEQALRRELHEELALEVTVLDEMYRLTVKTPDNKTLILHFLRALLKNDSTPVSCENQRFCWLEKSKLSELDWLDTDQEFVEYLAAAYSKA